MAEVGAETIGDTPEEKAKLIAGDTAKFAKWVKSANLSIDWPGAVAGVCRSRGFPAYAVIPAQAGIHPGCLLFQA